MFRTVPNKPELTGELTARFNYAEANRTQYDIRANENYKLYKGFRAELPKQLKGRSNLHIPKTYEAVTSLRARFLRALFATFPVIEYIPNPLLYFQEAISAQEYLQMILSAEIFPWWEVNNGY